MPNAIPDYAKIEVDVRFTTNAGVDRIKSAFEKIADKVYINGTSTKWMIQLIRMAMPCLPRTMELFETVRHIAVESKFPDISHRKVDGSSDSAYLVHGVYLRYALWK